MNSMFRGLAAKMYDKFLDLVATVLLRKDATSAFYVLVPYRGEFTIKELLLAGKYDRVGLGVTDKDFPQHRQGDEAVSIRLVCFGRNITTENALTKLKRWGMRPANPPELLALGYAYPQIHRKYEPIALGQFSISMDGRRRSVMHLCTDRWLPKPETREDEAERLVCVVLVTGTGTGWYRKCYFAVVEE